jgi:hypothetical protein
MSSWSEIVRYRANMEAVFSLTYDKNVLGQENYLNAVKKESTPNSLLRYSNFCPLTVQSMGVTPIIAPFCSGRNHVNLASTESP